MKTAIIGMGRMGRLRRKNLQDQDLLELAAVCDTVKCQYDDVVCYTDWRKLMEKEKPEVVFVCTYNDVISEIVCYALGKGCHVFSEKPPGRNLADVMAMKKAAENAPDCILKFGFNHRLHNSVLEASAILNSGQLGKVICARGAYGKAGAHDFATQWRSNEEIAGGGILLDQGIHMLDLLLYFMGDLELVSSIVDNYAWKDMSLEDNAMAMLKTADGRSAMLHSSATQWRHIFRLELLCESGYINLEGLITSTMSYGEERVRVGYKDIDQLTGKLGMPTEQIYYFDADQSWDLEVQEFVGAIKGIAPVVHGTIDDSVRLMALIEDIYKK